MRLAFAMMLAACASNDARHAAPPAPQLRHDLTSQTTTGVVDLHADLPYVLHVKHRVLDDAQGSPARLARGGVAVIVTPLFVPSAYAMPPRDVLREYEATFDALYAVKLPEGVSTWLSFEGADGFATEDGLAALDLWMARGVCLVGLVHDHANALGGASQDPSPAHRAQGLTDMGKRIAAHVIAHGGLLDVAHASDATFDDLAVIARAAGAPLVDSHTGMRALRDTMRNIDDDRLRVVAASGGIVGISMHGGHVGKTPGEHPTLADVADHVTHALSVAGRDHVAIGSDFDGSIDPPPNADGESVWPSLRVELDSRGLDVATLDAIFGANARRVFTYAQTHGCTPSAQTGTR